MSPELVPERLPCAPRPSLVAGLVFAACTAAGTWLWLRAVAPWLGYAEGSAVAALGLVVLYPLFVAPSIARGVAAGIVTAACALLLVCLRLPPHAAFFAVTAMLGVQRSGFLYVQPFARAVVTETALAAVALAAAVHFYDGSLLGTVFALWAFWLIQAGYALVPGRASHSTAPESRPPFERDVDPFDAAHDAAVAILEQRR